MDSKNKGRNDIARLVSDRQLYISSLELKLEKFTQNSQAFQDIKEKVDKLAYSLTAADEKIQGLTWLIKQQSESHQQQIKNIIGRYEELQQQMNNLAFGQNFNAEKHSQKSGNSLIEPKNSFIDYSKLSKDLQELIVLASQQVKNEVDQKFEIFYSKNSFFLKNLESKIETFGLNDEKTRQEIEKKFEKVEEKSENAKKDLENKMEAGLNMNLERYKELTHKINAGSGYSLNEELIGLRQKFSKIEEFKRNFEENEVRRELEVKEASQSAWNVENQLKTLETEVNQYKNFVGKGFDKDFKSFIEPYDKKLEFLSATVKKYLSVQKALHKKIESVGQKFSEKKQKKGILKSRSRSNKSKTSQKGDSSYSPTLNSSRVSFGNPTPRRPGKPGSQQKSRIDILYDELTNMFT